MNCEEMIEKSNYRRTFVISSDNNIFRYFFLQHVNLLIDEKKNSLSVQDTTRQQIFFRVSTKLKSSQISLSLVNGDKNAQFFWTTRNSLKK